MSKSETGEKSNAENHSLNRRNMLLGGTTLAAASAIATGHPVSVAQAQAQTAPPSVKRPNILFIMG
jgi:hypothetical protein